MVDFICLFAWTKLKISVLKKWNIGFDYVIEC